MRKQQKSKSVTLQKSGNIRIIAGKHRGRKLPVILADGLRPTTDRVKETVFNWLMPYVQNSECLDCFAGAGSLGFEALSRGAKSVTLLELNKTASTQLKQNQILLNATNMTVVNTDTLKFLAQTAQQYNLIFIDPPFRQNLLTPTIELLNNGLLAENAIIYLEMEKDNKDFIPPKNWFLLKEKSAGQVCYQLYKHAVA